MPFLAAPLLGAVIAGGAGAGISAAKSGKGSGTSSLQQQQLDLAAHEQQMKEEAIGETQPFLSQFYQGGDLTRTPFYRKLLALGTGSTTQAYQQAKVSAAKRGAMAGFGYSQPMTEGSTAGIEAREAGDLARVPTEAYMGAVDQGMKAASLRTNQAGQFNPSGYYDRAVELQRQADAKKSSLWSTLAGLGTRIATGFAGNDSSWG